MFTVILAMLLSPAGGVAAPQMTTKVGALASCKAKNLKEAADCLRTNLSEDDRIALVAATEASDFRRQIDRLVQFEFRLYEPDSDVGQWFQKREIKSRLIQSSVILSEYLSQQRGATTDLRAVAIAARGIPDGTPPVASDFLPRENAVKQTLIPSAECSTLTKIPLSELGECIRIGDRITVSRKTKASSN